MAHAEPDTTWSTNPGSSSAPDSEANEDRDGPEPDREESEDEPSVGENEEDDNDNDDALYDDARYASEWIDGEAIATDRLDDAQVDRPPPASIEAGAPVPTGAHGVDEREAALRRHSSWLGRVDVSITWRRALNESTAVQRQEVWLVGTWRL
ncbi:MAG: hypothetical protein AB7T06_48020 [Kofleriaceae bacterium]